MLHEGKAGVSIFPQLILYHINIVATTHQMKMQEGSTDKLKHIARLKIEVGLRDFTMNPRGCRYNRAYPCAALRQSKKMLSVPLLVHFWVYGTNVSSIFKQLRTVIPKGREQNRIFFFNRVWLFSPAFWYNRCLRLYSGNFEIRLNCKKRLEENGKRKEGVLLGVNVLLQPMNLYHTYL